jgi:hypothetical protein
MINWGKLFLLSSLFIPAGNVYSQNDLIFIDRYDRYSTIRLNDTGVDECVDGVDLDLPCPVNGFPVQDGDAGRDYLARIGQLVKVGDGAAGFDFTKISAAGDPLPFGSPSWSCVRDNHTGLIWEHKSTDGGLHDRFNNYSWYEPDGSLNGGGPGLQDGGNCSGSLCDTHHFVEAVNTEGYCGIDRWRLPTVVELNSIVNFGARNPSIDTTYFANHQGFSYWSNSPAVDPDDAWFVGFFEGGHGSGAKTIGRSVVLVADIQ